MRKTDRVTVLYENKYREDIGVVAELVTEHGVRITIRNNAYFGKSREQMDRELDAVMAKAQRIVENKWLRDNGYNV